VITLGRLGGSRIKLHHADVAVFNAQAAIMAPVLVQDDGLGNRVAIKRLFGAHPHTGRVVTLDTDYRVVEQAVASRLNPQACIPGVEGPLFDERADQLADATTGTHIELGDDPGPHS
jgi:hypothetical protein